MIVGTGKFQKVINVDSNNAGDEKPLISRASGDSTDFVQLYRRHYEAVFQYCLHRLFERQLAEDITSEVFLKVVENFDGFKGNDKQFRCWLYRIATNAVNNHLRKTARRNRLLRFFRERRNSQVDDCGEPGEKLAVLRKAAFTLRPRYQTIIALRFFENLKLTEIAEVLGSSPGTVRSQLKRALAELRSIMPAEFE